MANQISFTQKKVNKDGVFFLEGEDLGESPMIVITSPVMTVSNPIRQVEKVAEKRYKITLDLAYQSNKVSGQANATIFSGAVNDAAGDFFTRLIAFFKAPFSLDIKYKSKKRLFAWGAVLVVCLFGGMKGFEYVGILEEDTLPGFEQIADTGQKLASEEGRKQVFNAHSFFESTQAKQYEKETGLDLDSVYATFSPNQIIRKRPVQMKTLDEAQEACESEIEDWDARVPTLEELQAVMANKTVAGKLRKKTAEWTATDAPGTFDDMILYISDSKFWAISGMFTTIEQAAESTLDEVGSGFEDGQRGDLSDSAYKKKLKQIALKNHGLPVKAEIDDEALILDEDEKFWFRCIKDVPADEGVKMASK